MQKKKSSAAGRAWNTLRVALLWARKGGVLKLRSLMMDLRLFPKFLKTLAHSAQRRRHSSAIYYGERELSFDDTPIIHVKMHRRNSMRFRMPHIPCINPPRVDFDYDFESNGGGDNDAISCYYIDDGARKSFLKSGDEDDNDDCEVWEETIPCDDEGIDLKAEQFIAKFYQQMKMETGIVSTV